MMPKKIFWLENYWCVAAIFPTLKRISRRFMARDRSSCLACTPSWVKFIRPQIVFLRLFLSSSWPSPPMMTAVFTINLVAFIRSWEIRKTRQKLFACHNGCVNSRMIARTSLHSRPGNLASTRDENSSCSMLSRSANEDGLLAWD